MPDANSSELSFDNQERKLLSSFFNFFAELNEFKYFFFKKSIFRGKKREKLENKGKIRSFEKVVPNYMRALNYYPYEGKYYMNLACYY